jgi:hypothetical protein
MDVEQVVTDDTYTVALHAAGFTVHLGPDLANRLAYDLTEAALEPARCRWEHYPAVRFAVPLEGCENYAAPGEDFCARHLADADDTPHYASERQA